jgi:capsular polysaccharide biosynthesis protein
MAPPLSSVVLPTREAREVEEAQTAELSVEERAPMSASLADTLAPSPCAIWPVDEEMEDAATCEAASTGSPASLSNVEPEVFRTCVYANVCFMPKDDGEDSELPQFGERTVSQEYPSADEWMLAMDPRELAASPPNRSVFAAASGRVQTFDPRVLTDASALPSAADATWIEEDAVALWRQYHGNYYHVVFDDLIALWYLARRSFGRVGTQHTIVLNDLNLRMDADAMLKSMSRSLWTRHDLGKPTCFRRLAVGPAMYTWGGRGRVLITDDALRAFVHDLRHLVGLSGATPPRAPGTPRRIGLIRRTHNRLVLNEAELVAGLQATYPHDEILVLQLENHTFAEQTALMATLDALIGVHGAGLTNLLFLPPHAPTIELYPWKWDRRAYERISKKLRRPYFKWLNTRREATVFHEDTFLGVPGIDEATADLIRSSDGKPFGLGGQAAIAGEKYWINQDTTVDVPSFLDVMLTALPPLDSL